MIASLNARVDPNLVINISKLYDATSILSFISAWIVTVLMLKQYSNKISKLRFWFLIATNDKKLADIKNEI